MGNPKECLSTHSVLHSALGLGLGFLIVALVPSLASSALLLGVVFILLAFGGELIGKKK